MADGQHCDRRATGTRQRYHANEHREHEDPDANPHGSGPEIAVDVTADASAQPQPPDHDDGDKRREVLRAHGALEAQARDSHHDDVGDVVSDDHRRQRAKNQTLDEREGHGRSCGAPAERVLDSTNQTTRDEKGPALDFDRAQQRSHCGRRQHEPAGRIPKRRCDNPGDEECPDPKLRNGERCGPPHRHEREERRGRQDDAYRVAGSTRREEGTGAF